MNKEDSNKIKKTGKARLVVLMANYKYLCSVFYFDPLQCLISVNKVLASLRTALNANVWAVFNTDVFYFENHICVVPKALLLVLTHTSQALFFTFDWVWRRCFGMIDIRFDQWEATIGRRPVGRKGYYRNSTCLILILLLLLLVLWLLI